MASLRGITKKSVAFFQAEAEKGVFSQHDVMYGSEQDDQQIYHSDDYRQGYRITRFELNSFGGLQNLS